MSKIFYIADMHIGHENVLAFDNRPFKTIEEHDETLIANWNSTVGNNDTVYSLGDMFWRNIPRATEIMRTLKGNKVLIKGNHDKTKDLQFAREFDEIVEYKEVIDGDKNVILCHYPILCFKNQHRGWIHLYGHTHIGYDHNILEHNKYLMEELYLKKCEMYNVGAMMPYINYTPTELNAILYYHIGKEKNGK